MSNYFDEIPWIPCLSAQGTKKLTLKALLEECSAYQDFAVSGPTKKAALWLSVCSWIASAVMRRELDPEDFDLSDVVAYLQEHRWWFEQENFCQVPQHQLLTQKKPVLLMALETELESGNNANFFTKTDHERAKNYSAAEVAFCLLQGHWFGLAGLGGGFGKQKFNFLDCPAARCLVVVARDKNLATSLEENARQFLGKDFANGALIADSAQATFLPAWEREDGGAGLLETGEPPADTVPLCLSFGLHRAFQVVWHGDQATAYRRAKGWEVPEDALISCRMIAASERTEPGAGGTRVLKIRADPKRAVWRDLHSILECFQSESGVFWRPDIAWVVEVFGMFTPSQAKIEGETQSLFHVPIEVVEDQDTRDYLKRGLELFENGGRYLYAVLKEGSDKALSAASKRSDKERIQKLLARSAAFDTYWDACAVHFFGEMLPGLVRDRTQVLKAAEKARFGFLRQAESIYLSEFPKGRGWYHLAGFLQSRSRSKSKKREVRS